MEFKFELDQLVIIRVSGETGRIVGRAQYTNRWVSYLVRYKCADGRGVEAWWDEDALQNG